MIYPEKPIIKDLKYDEDIEDITKWGAAGAHDPSIFKDDDLYYVFSTDARIGGKATPSIQIRKSYDLIMGICRAGLGRCTKRSERMDRCRRSLGT